MNNFVYVVQMMRENGAVMGVPLAIFSELDKAERFVSDEHKYTFAGVSSIGYIYKNEYKQRLVIREVLVK